ncbi:MAG: redoxin family protein [Xanthomonadales bacterium]|nr:redoxin family protein [Xanthomonadales bacterium]
MKRLLLPVLFVIFAVVGGSAGFLIGGWFYDNPPAPPGIEQIELRQPVPEFSMPDPAGTPQALSQWRGRLVLVNYWASWCPPCIDEMPMLDAYAQRHAGRGLVIVGIAEDDHDAARQFLADNPVAYPILLGNQQFEGSSMQLGNSRNVLPFSVLIGPDGRLLARKVGVLDDDKLDDWLAPHWPDA